MAAAARFPPALAWLSFALITFTRGFPLTSPPPLATAALQARWDPEISTVSNGTIIVTNPDTGNVTAQGLASDGSGHDFNASAIIWIVYCFVIGVPLALLGIKIPRMTIGIGIGITATACLWAAFINTEPADSLSDLVVTLIPVCLFLPGFLFGFHHFGHLAGVILIVVASGFSWGVRICLFREDLLVREVYGDWLIGASFAVIHVLVIPHFERIAVALASASVGTFFIALGIDLAVNKQEGMSLGLRLMCDRNKHHWVDLVLEGWKPPTSTIIIVAISLPAALLFAYAQHRLFPKSYRKVPEDDEEEIPPLPERASITDEKEKPPVRIRIAVQEASSTSAPTPVEGSIHTESDINLMERRQSQLTDSSYTPS
ncbi:uncharacterized protein LAESUDRAFT_813506 [Laetiporus sulphureus 93-53]|uniref:TM7S3/TM198-like domain-containing protein n=1 Tax=Laetiporus sulphureus 93-53 TaxID=1314785 RepID=A0A165DQC2_9APHY|nr:uncharacterized protein LAESUDRAFT_813506 [Laetiporus sulphureus 93-53]KZT05392.1 hypothetical protein LAESUDRAFT_813506 [Laetiporus sulphureus 93-53]